MNDLSGTQVKGYQIVEKLGAGGMGNVYRALRPPFNNEVAMKAILPQFANHPDFIRRFELEAQIIARLDHHYIVPLYDYWRDPDGAYLVMRWLRGGNLREQIHENGKLGIEDIVNIIDQVAQGLHSAHRSQVIHRDIKPDNILLDEDGNAFITDFGIAKDYVAQSNITADYDTVGTPKYMSPEQASGENVTPRSDIYSLGIVLYEMLERQHPFPDAQLVDLIFKQINDPLPSAKTPPPDLQMAINDVIQKATAKDPAKRFSDVLEMARALRDAANLTPSQVGKMSLVELLTPREQEVMQLIIDGKTNREIAEVLVVQVSSVKSHINSIYKKLNVRSRVQAIARSRELDFVIKKPQTSVGVALPEPENPYKGLRAFQVADEQDFFGRSQLVHKLLSRINEDAEYRRFLAIVGPSGSGKSSVTRAGLIPALWRGQVTGSENWYIADMLPGTNPIDELEVALLKVASEREHLIREHLNRDVRGLVRVADLILPDDHSELLIVIDQFEEVFTLLNNKDQRQHLLNLLLTAVTDKRSRVRIIVTLRADYYDRPLQYPEFGVMMQNRVETVLPLNADELQQAVRQPAEQVGVTFEDGLISRIVSDVRYQPGALPLMQYAMTELFERRDGLTLTLEAYEAIGGTGGALAKRADEIYLEFDEKGQELIRQMFLRLVTLGEGAEDTRRRTERDELLKVTSDADIMDEVIDTYALSRLLSLDNDPTTRQPTVEVAHEAILREWDRLRQWLNESRDDIKQERMVAQATTDWIQNNRDVSYLLTGTRLEQVQHWLQTSQIALTPLESEFIETGINEAGAQEIAEAKRLANEQAQEKRSRILLRTLVLVLTLASMISIGLAITANMQRQFAVDQTNVIQSLLLVQGAQDANEGNNPEQAVALAVAASNIETAPQEAFQMLSKVATAPGVVQHIQTPDNSVEHLQVPQDGNHLISASRESIFVWDLQTGNEVHKLDSHTGQISFIALSEDDTLLASTATDGSVIIWDWRTGQQTQQITTPYPQAVYAYFVPHQTIEQAVLVLSTDARDRGDTGEVIGQSELALYDALNGEMIEIFDTPELGNVIQYFNVSDDGSRLVVRHRQPNLEQAIYGLAIWNLETGERIRKQLLEEHPALWPSLALLPQSNLSANGELMLLPLVDFQTGNIDVQIVETDSGNVRETLLEDRSTDLYQWIDSSTNSAYIYTEAGYGQYSLKSGDLMQHYNVAGVPHISSDNNYIVFNENGRGIVVIDTAHGAKIAHYIFATNDQIESIPVFSADGQYVITGDVTGEIRIWSLFPEIELQQYSGHQAPATVAEYMPDGHTILSASGLPPRAAEGFGDLHLWDVTTGELLQQYDGHNAPIWGLAISPDGQTAISSGLDGSMKAWNIETGELSWQLQLESNRIVERLEFTPNGSAIVGGLTVFDFSVSLDSAPEIVVWDATSGQENRRYELDVPPFTHSGITAIAISPDGQSVLATVLSGAGSQLFWVDLNTNETLLKLTESHLIRTDGLAFHPNGTMALTGSFDNAVRLWNLETGELIRQFDGHTTAVHSVAFHTDAEFAVSGSGLPGIAGESDDVVIVWDVATGVQIQRFEGHTASVKHVAFSPDGNHVVSAATDGTIRIWDIIYPEELFEWVYTNRYVRDLDCVQREFYRVEPLCDDNAPIQ